jgi:hypothetical protein
MRNWKFIKFTPPACCRLFDIARGSALECAAALDPLAYRLHEGD